jgi:HSP20 family molecular chaperone IbpA
VFAGDRQPVWFYIAYSERCAKEILRVIYLPAEVDSSKASATLKDGILNIELPKAAHAQTVRIEPKAV